jgi:hypothetical protein
MMTLPARSVLKVHSIAGSARFQRPAKAFPYLDWRESDAVMSQVSVNRLRPLDR